MARRGVIYAVEPVAASIVNVIWAGTDDGLIHVTRDGGQSWTNVTPPELSAWDKVSHYRRRPLRRRTRPMPPSIRFASTTCVRTSIARTTAADLDARSSRGVYRDGVDQRGPRGPAAARAAVRRQRSEAVYVSFDDGEHWQSLRLNMPATSIRDLVIKDDDLVVGTHGRRFWILDDITPLRQLPEAIARPGRVSVPPPARDAVPLEHEHRHAAAARRAGRRRTRRTARSSTITCRAKRKA